MVEQNYRKISKFTQFKIKLSQKLDKFKQNYQTNAELKTVVGVTGEILFLGFLSLLAFLGLTNPSLILKLLGFGSALWLVKSVIVPDMFVPLLNAFRLVTSK